MTAAQRPCRESTTTRCDPSLVIEWLRRRFRTAAARTTPAAGFTIGATNLVIALFYVGEALGWHRPGYFIVAVVFTLSGVLWLRRGFVARVASIQTQSLK